MIDDVLDYDANPAHMGKNVGDDLTEGKVTLPLIHTLRSGTQEERALVQRAITEKSAAQIDQVTAAVKRCGALEYTRKRAGQYRDAALENLAVLPASAARDGLQQLTHLSMKRDR